MDDPFAYRSAVPIRRVDPRVVRACVWLAVAVVVVALFANWVIASEHRSLARPVPIEAGRSQAPAGVAPASDAVVVAEPEATEADAAEALRRSVDAARAAFATDGSWIAATPARLAELQPGYLYVDGPSTTATVVSVAADDQAWAAAVLGPDGTCLWTTVSGEDVAARAGGECTGAAALASLSSR